MAFIPIGITSIVNTVPSSVQVGASIMGSVPINGNFAEDSGHTSGNTGVFILGVRNDTNTNLTNTDLDYSPIAVDAPGRVLLGNSSALIGQVAISGGVNLNSTSGSVITVHQGSVGAVLLNSSVTALQGTNPWQINVPSPSTIAYQAAGSIMAVSGSFSASPQSSINALQLAGSILAVNLPSPSIIAYQLAGSIMAVAATVNTGNSSVQLLGGVAAIGSVAVLQGTNPWQVNLPSPSIIAYQLAGSIMATSATVNTGNSSVQLLGGIATIGSVVALQGGVWATSMVGGPIQVNSILGTYLEKSASVPSVIGFPMLFRSNSTTSVLTTPSTTDPLPVQGSVTTLQGTNPWTVGPTSVQLMSTSASVITVQNYGYGSVMLMASTNASVAVLASQGTNPWVIGSIVGTYAEDTPSGAADKGLVILGVRNDAVASLVNADLDYTIHSMDSAGRFLFKPFAANEASIYAHASVVNGGDSGSVVVLAAAGAGLRNYITDWNVSNTGSVATLVTFTEGGGSIIGRTIAPAGGGSNMPGMNSPMRNNLANQPINMVTATASSVVYVAMYGHKGP